MKNVAVRSPVRHATHAGEIQFSHKLAFPFSQWQPHCSATHTRVSRSCVSFASNGKPNSATDFSKSAFTSSNAAMYSFASTALAFQLARSNQLAYEIDVARDKRAQRFDHLEKHAQFVFAIEFLVERFKPFAHMRQHKRLLGAE